jgi:hypothetical protein
MLRRWSLGLALSVALHALAVAAVIGLALARSQVGPIDVELTGITEVKDLPLGPPPGAARAGPARRAHPHPRAPRAPDEVAATLAAREEAAASRAAEETAAADAEEEAAPRASDLRELGPEGSRLTVLLRVDRLKTTRYAAVVDHLLMRLPDRRELLYGTGLELYDAFDALLISTPNPRDPAVTFLAARHHLSDTAMRDALDSGARATGRSITWRTERGRPWAERGAAGDDVGAPGNGGARDQRIVVLPAPGLVVVTPPAYRALLLAPAPPPALRRDPADGGADPAEGAADPPDGGAGEGDAPEQPGANWRALLRRIDAEDGLLPPEGIVMVSAVDILKPASGVATDTAVVMGMEVPRIVTAVLGADPDPFLEITAEFAAEAEARHWEAEWPALQRKARSNPYVLLGGFAALVGRATLSRDGRVIHARQTATHVETMRLLELAAQMLGG